MLDPSDGVIPWFCVVALYIFSAGDFGFVTLFLPIVIVIVASFVAFVLVSVANTFNVYVFVGVPDFTVIDVPLILK